MAQVVDLCEYWNFVRPLHENVDRLVRALTGDKASGGTATSEDAIRELATRFKT